MKMDDTAPPEASTSNNHHIIIDTPYVSTSSSLSSSSSLPTKRLYQVWKGNNRFFFGGRISFGPDMRSLIFTLFLIVTPVITFCVFVSPRLIHGIHHHLGILVVTIPAVFTVYVVVLLLLTSGGDPGIIPRNPHPLEMEADDDTSSASTDWTGYRGGASSFRPTKDVVVNGMVIKVKYCHTCMLYRSPRCSHCSICNNCVERFDHHCPWVGQCIGKRNYKFFFMFVSSTTVLCLYVFAFCWVNINLTMEVYHCNLGRALLKSPVPSILIAYTFVASWFVGGLTAFHLYLISTNQTTYENFRYRYDGKMNPFSRGLLHNIGEVFCSNIPKSKINFREIVKERTSSLPMGRAMSPELPKRSFGVEMGGKRKAVGEEELKGIQSQIEGVNRLERCLTEPRHIDWGHKDNCEITRDLHTMDAELQKGTLSGDREKINGVL
ncbi:hypothetical protein IFM89_002927 [Coptis chinensis]|uniref:S-acyltransferase n=1 Tax=Coptis chinensis TaxID=261450 RepID=A0A835IMF8_9MAGN|nr:hypothetical protein IFM89_002927 [Coptis chinensis]